jgi:hypothetical protein
MIVVDRWMADIAPILGGKASNGTFYDRGIWGSGSIE